MHFSEFVMHIETKAAILFHLRLPFQTPSKRCSAVSKINILVSHQAPLYCSF